MPRKPKTQPCPECGGLMVYEKRTEVLTYQGRERTIKSLGRWCPKCGEGILSGESLRAHQEAFLAFKAEVDQVLSPAQVLVVRESLA